MKKLLVLLLPLAMLAACQGKGEKVEFADVLANVKERDYIDSHRKVSPLAKADDAVVLDNSEMTLEDQMVWIRKLLAGKFGEN